MGFGIKTKIKRIIATKEYVPISHPVSTSNEFIGKVALISGGSGGIGLAIAKSLQESGCTVVIAGTNEKKLASLKNETCLDTIVMNYSKPESFVDVIKEVVARHGKLDIFISSAGVHTENVDFWKMYPDEFDRVMDINLKGVFFACWIIWRFSTANPLTRYHKSERPVPSFQ